MFSPCFSHPILKKELIKSFLLKLINICLLMQSKFNNTLNMDYYTHSTKLKWKRASFCTPHITFYCLQL